MRINGTVIHSVYDDAELELYQLLGNVTITRFSHVEYDNNESIWTARRPFGEILCKASTREECLAMEKQIANKEINY
jgi:hypothetical protein